MKKMYLLAVLMAAAMPFTSMAQDDDLYFNPKKEAKEKAERKLRCCVSTRLSRHAATVSMPSSGAAATGMWMSTTVVADS